MVSDEHYEICLPILSDTTLEDEEKTDRLEDLLRDQTSLKDSALEHAVLDALWRYRDGSGSVAASPPPIRHTIMRRPSPASWRGNSSPAPGGSPRLGVSPLAPPGFVPSNFNTWNKSSTVSPFSSPRPSPRLAFATPAIPNSPNLNAYQFAQDTVPSQETFGEFQKENVEWLVADDAVSTTSSAGTAGTSSGLNASAPEFSSLSSQQNDMSPYDMLRSILGHAMTDEEIEAALAVNGYDLSATIVALMESQGHDSSYAAAQADETAKGVLIGKSMMPEARPRTPAGQSKSGVICKFYMSSGQCLRSDCRFSHDLSNHLCKYWVMGNCLAGDTCIFSHDPAHLVNKISIDGASTPPKQPHLQMSDYASFPSLQPGTPEHAGNVGYPPMVGVTPPPGLRPFHHSGESPRSRSRPGSRQQQAREPALSAPSLDDADAFPTLGSAAAAKQGKKHHGKRGGHGHKENISPSSLAEIVKMTPSPGPAGNRQDLKKMGRNGSSTSIRNGENSAAAQAIPNPKHIPWLETGERANKAYLKARQEAIKHGGLRNKFLQSAAQAWNRNDARAAKALSLRGQSENDLMRKAHREAARELYEERNKGATSSSSSSEVYVDLHGQHPDEAVEYLEKVLLENSKESRPIYAITGTGHHSKNGKDKVGKAIRNWLNEWRYVYREFSVPGDRNNMGGILGIDARSYDKSLLARDGDEAGNEDGGAPTSEGVDILSEGVEIGDGKVRLLVRDPPKGPSGRR